MAETLGWRARHEMALLEPNDIELPFVLLRQAIEAYVEHAENGSAYITGDGHGQWRDYVHGPEIGSLLSSFVRLLNGETSRLDYGSLDTWARETASRIGYDMDTETYG